MHNIKHVILILSGKGGVGKSTIATQIALGLQALNFKVGLLDVDLCGPSIPYLLSIENHAVHHSDGGWLPVYVDKEQTLGVMSIAFLLDDRNNSVVWRGPKKNSMIKEFLTNVTWGTVDYLIIDTPPGTSDEHISVMEHLRSTAKCDGAIIVTSPQQVAIEDVRKEITFCKKTGIPILGLIENMSSFVCPNCKECTNIFSKGGGVELAKLHNIDCLGVLPFDPRIDQCHGQPFAEKEPDATAAFTFNDIVGKVVQKVSIGVL